MALSSKRPYLLRAMYDWINDNLLTPYLVVDTRHEGVMAPIDLAQNDRLVLNISQTAVTHWFTDNQGASFSARFGSRSIDVYLPMESILAVYAKENGQGMLFSDFIADEETSGNAPVKIALVDSDEPTIPHPVDDDEDDPKPPRPTLRIVK